MDEASIEESLKGYREQLDQINIALQTADDLTKLELYDLEKDLKELIAFTEDSLFSLKKERLLSLLKTDDEKSASTSSLLESRPTKSCGETSKDMSNTKEEEEEEENKVLEEEDDFVGTKCRVKYTQEWGSFQYHNAMVLSVEVEEKNDDLDSSTDLVNQMKVRVLFLNPIHKSMVPCKFFLDGQCNYTEENCRYSHGYLVDVEELQEYEEPDFTKLTVGGECLAKYDENGVWYEATVSELHEEQVTVSFNTYNKTSTLDYHSVIPVVSNNMDHSESSSSEEESNDVATTEGIAKLSYTPSTMSGPLGGWEEHTKGIGSKLMAKMGYVFGKGLGKDSQGRIEPVEIRLLPPGKSLDKIAELREKGLVKDPTKRIKRRKQTVASEMKAQEQKAKEHAAFHLINHLSKKARGTGGHGSNSHPPNTSFSIEDTYKSLKNNPKDKKKNSGKNDNKSNINVQVFKNSEKISALRKKLAKQKDALLRNPGDSTVSRTIKLNIVATERELEELTAVERALQSKVHMKNQSKKLSIF